MNQLRTLSSLITLVGTTALAQPTVRPTLTGLSFMNANQAFIQEPWTTRVPGTTTPPFVAVPPFLTQHARELIEAPAGANLSDPWPCSWTLTIIGDPTQPMTAKLSPGPLAITWARYSATYDLHPSITLNPCDIDLSGTTNVLDFMTFLNTPSYDWNGDGVFNVFDFNDFLNTCSN